MYTYDYVYERVIDIRKRIEIETSSGKFPLRLF